MSGNSSNAACVQDYFKFDTCKDFSIDTCSTFPCAMKVDPDIGGIGVGLRRKLLLSAQS